MANPSNSPRPSGVNLGVYVLLAILAVSIIIVSVAPSAALFMVPAFLLALVVATFWLRRAAFATTAEALGRRVTPVGAQDPIPVEPEPIPDPPAPPPAAWPGVTMGEEYLAVRLSDLLRGLSDAQAECIFKVARWETMPAGTPMATAGSTAECIYIIADGTVQLTGQSGLGDVTVRVAREGEAFPLAALLGSGELVTSAKAATEVSALVVGQEELLHLCEERPDIGMVIFKTTAEMLADRYRSTLKRHLEGAEQAVRQSDTWANV